MNKKNGSDFQRNFARRQDFFLPVVIAHQQPALAVDVQNGGAALGPPALHGHLAADDEAAFAVFGGVGVGADRGVQLRENIEKFGGDEVAQIVVPRGKDRAGLARSSGSNPPSGS